MLATILNFSYASFPILENVKQSSDSLFESTVYSDSEDIIYYSLGFSSRIFKYSFIFCHYYFCSLRINLLEKEFTLD